MKATERTLAWFMRQVNTNGPVVPYVGTSCWVRTSGIRKDGYGKVYLGDRKYTTAHRFSWAVHFGPIPDALCVCHRCDTRSCVRPDHLFLGTSLDNARDKTVKGRASHKGVSLPGERNPRTTLTNIVVKQMRQLFQDGASTADIRAMCGCSENTAWRIASGIGWADAVPDVDRGRRPSRSGRPGAANPMHKVKEADVLRIRQRLQDGDSVASVANDYNLSSAYVRQIRRGERWAHVLGSPDAHR